MINLVDYIADPKAEARIAKEPCRHRRYRMRKKLKLARAILAEMNQHNAFFADIRFKP